MKVKHFEAVCERNGVNSLIKCGGWVESVFTRGSGREGSGAGRGRTRADTKEERSAAAGCPYHRHTVDPRVHRDTSPALFLARFVNARDIRHTVQCSDCLLVTIKHWSEFIRAFRYSRQSFYLLIVYSDLKVFCCLFTRICKQSLRFAGKQVSFAKCFRYFM